jgi:hypothetical protein
MNDNETLEKDVSHLLQLFEEREQLYTVGTGRIMERLGPTVIAALYEFFNVSYESINWLHFEVDGGILLIGAVVSYKNTDIVPEIINRLSPLIGESKGHLTEVQRAMRIGIPLHVVFLSKEEVLQFLNDHVGKQPTPEAPPPTIFVDKATGEIIEAKLEPLAKIVPADFDNTQLSREQLTQLLHTQHLLKGTKH